jgi:hypothetical protein
MAIEQLKWVDPTALALYAGVERIRRTEGDWRDLFPYGVEGWYAVADYLDRPRFQEWAEAQCAAEAEDRLSSEKGVWVRITDGTTTIVYK